MNGYLLDTNVISEYSRKKSPDEHLRRWIDAQNEDTLHLSVLTLGEIRKGTTLLAPSIKRTELEKWLETDLPVRFNNRLLPITGLRATGARAPCFIVTTWFVCSLIYPTSQTIANG